MRAPRMPAASSLATSSAVSSAVLCAAFALVAAAGCTGGGGGGKTSCVNALDCDLDEACRGGECVPNEPADAGEVSDGGIEGGDEAAAVAAICQRVSSCQGSGDTQGCIEQTQAQFDQLHQQQTEICEKVAADLAQLYTCAASVTCDALSDTTRLEASCPIFAQVEDEIQQCPAGIEGEGEGEPPPPPGECFVSRALDPTPTSDVFLIDVFGNIDAEPSPLCGTRVSASIRIDVEGPSDLAALAPRLITSFDQITAFDGQGADFSQPGVISAVACGDDSGPSGSIAVQLLFPDGTQTNAVCGPLAFP